MNSTDCPNPVPLGTGTNTPATGTADTTITSLPVGTTIVYTCLDGYATQVESSLTLTCNDGSWGTPPTCVQGLKHWHANRSDYY